ncbi:hypothetical protein NLI96_g12226 [Meripilus lineatus]|uniref:Arrestin-like N-terminal domain-containing protein n=1 Tax=Meripilus lineatus TaxID=2056292 RepID=A0AAD5URZ5_9APHY|nr:hypothetical protein NLI96_g12226 [Physisporinus lineatus]
MTAITLHFVPSLRVGGELISGTVDLLFPTIIEEEVQEVHVKLRGAVDSKIVKQRNKHRETRRDTMDIVRVNCSIWTKGTAYPTDSSNILRLPFQLPLPLDVPPSCRFEQKPFFGPERKGDIAYFVEVVGVRNGWSSPYRLSRASRCSPRYLSPFGSSRRRNKGRFELRHKTGAVFPEPPRTPRGVSFVLRRHVNINARSWSSDGDETVAHIGGLGSAAPFRGDGGVVTTYEKKWVPTKNTSGLGHWTQETILGSTFIFTSTPSFLTPIMSQTRRAILRSQSTYCFAQLFGIQHYLRLKIEFPGVGNNLEKDIPINITSGMDVPPAVGAVPPPVNLDLPPAYWTVVDGVPGG